MNDAATMRLVRTAAHWFGLGLLTFYLGWNAWWIGQSQVPPALLTAITGLPSPTTGGTRSALALLAGDLRTSLYFNPLTIPLIGLLAWTLYRVCQRGMGDRWLAYAWVGLLLVAWVAKLASPVGTW